MKRIYLDNAATTPLDPRVSLLMRTFETKFFGNPNSVHREGQQARARIDTSREQIAKFFAVQPQEIIFTSGATESNNLAIQGAVSDYLQHQNMKPHVITTQIEHLSVHNVVKTLQENGVIEATFVSPNKDGVIDAKSVIKEIKENTVLISVIFVSNEIGSLNPIREIGKYLADYNKTVKSKVIFHTDAVQAIKHYNCNFEKLGTDLLTFSAHKIFGPKGIGGLVVKSGTKINSVVFGGSQEYGKRPGTQNTSAIIGMAEAFKILGTLEQRQAWGEKLRILKTDLLEFLALQKAVVINGPTDLTLSCPDIINFSIKGIDPDTALTKLDLKGLALSTGSACVSGSTQPSHVISALGKIQKGDSATIRVSLGKQNTKQDIKALKAALTGIMLG